MPDSVSPAFTQQRPPMSETQLWSVVCDFDGTIATVDVTDDLLERFALPEWQQIEAQWQSGAINARECMAQQVALLRVTRLELYAHLATIHIDPGFREFVADCQARWLPLQIVSDGIDRVIRRVLRRRGVADLPVFANRLVSTSRNTYALEFPNAKPDCKAASGTCKCAIAAAAKPRRVLLIGDGVSDFCLAQSADFVFSKGKLTHFCESRGIPHRDFSEFADIRYLLSELLDHPHHHLRPRNAAASPFQAGPTWSI